VAQSCGVAIRTINVTRYVTPLREGGSLPAMRTLPIVLTAIVAASALGAAQGLDVSRYHIVDLSHAYGANTL
jgi:hypothetical protein